MPSVAMSGNDTINLNNHVFVDLADGDCVTLSFPNNIANVKTGKNGNSIYGLDESGNQCEIKIRVLRGSNDDKFLNGLLAQQRNNFSGFPLMIGQFIKKIGDGTGNVTNDTYITAGGVFDKNVDAKMNVQGDTEQSVAIYSIKGATANRVIT